jgi:hypothetical protein
VQIPDEETTMTHHPSITARLLLAFGLLMTLGASLRADELERGWADPPRIARLRAYWWWLNGQATKAAITRDLEEMKAKGFGGALLCDAGGAEQDGNDPVPHGPTFLTPPWRELYKHALREADRLGLEMSLNIQSGWNLGGPVVPVEDAAKKLVWSELRVTGPAKFAWPLPAPPRRDGFYRDLFVVAYRLKAEPQRRNLLAGVTASSSQDDHPASAAADGNRETFWVSAGGASGQGPTRQQPAWLQFEFTEPVTANRLSVTGRPGYGPRECELQVSDDGRQFRPVKAFSAAEKTETTLQFADTRARFFRLAIFGAFDPRFPDRPRNVQIAELGLAGKDGAWLIGQRRRPLENWEQKAVHKALHFSAPDTTPLLRDVPPEPGEEDTPATGVQNLTAQLDQDGVLHWEVPDGVWQVLRFGCTVGNHARVSTCSEGWQGYALDVLDAGAFIRYWDAVVEPLIADAGPLVGRTLKYLHTDSWEVEAVNWTPTLPAEFRQRRGYDLVPLLPVLAGRIVDSRQVSNRFLHDFRKTLGDLAIDNHYRPFRDRAHRHGLEIHPESGGPHAVPIDAQRCLGFNDVPMSEFWAWSWRHRIGDTNRFFVKQPASAAHTYGRRLVAAEGFTTIGPHWQETLWDNLKPSFDRAACEGLNLLVWHAFVCSPAELGMPGIQYFAGTHFNPNTTWWDKSAPFLSYINRCQFLLQQGLFVADACYYYGDHVPNFAQLKQSDPARVLPGYDYDVLTEEALLQRCTVKDSRIVLPDGMSYRVLVLPNHAAISLPALRKVKELVAAGATVVGPRLAEASGLQGYPQCDAEVAELARALWGADAQAASGPAERRPAGKGRVVADQTAREVLLADGVPPDFEFAGDEESALDYIHRRAGQTEIYFVASRANRAETVACTFRVTGLAPELWNPVTGERRLARAYSQADGRTTVPLDFAPYGSWFVVFREPAANHPATARGNCDQLEAQQELTGLWTVRFDPRWGGPASVTFDRLVSWSEREEAGVRYYSGTATYAKTFDLPGGGTAVGRPLWLDLGSVRQLAEVRVNGKSLGVVWAPPFQVEITDAVKPAGNRLEVEVVNFWPNRIIGDQGLPPEKRFTRTNIRKLTKTTPLMESGLLGPVRLLVGPR